MGSGLGRKLVIVGIDPGMQSLAMTLLVDGKIASVYQKDRKKKERAEGDTKEWISMVIGMLENNDPHVVGLEGTQHQPWRAKGNIPKGMVALEHLVDEMQAEIIGRGIICYQQQPSIQAQYDNAIIERMIKRAMGRDYKILPHLISSTKHALHAESTYLAAQARKRGRG